ncbi:MAG: glycosyltransferase family 1 protein [Holophaga sp.]|nr:glycosyltransferase family 1 protein [Holophaga sp.]
MSGTPVRVVAVPLKEFNGWAGGVDFVRMILEGLLHDPALRVVALLPRPTWVKRARQFPGSILAALKGRRPERPMDPRQVRAALADFAPRLAFHVYPDSRRGLRAALVAVGADVAIPCLRPMPASPVPWVGYLYDFQHRYFPQLFSQAERDGRDLAFARMLAAAPVVICNSDAVRADAERFHPGGAARIVVLPFAPTVRPAWLDLDPGPARRRHAVPERYFMVCNQFWIHKDHPTAIRAFAAFLQAGGDPATALVCTGGLQDFRDPGYPGTIRALIAQLNLTGKVHLLGHLAKDEQIALLRGAIAVLQPTWFEGGRGGGAASDALALGVPALLSDIAVNREIVQDGCRFFPKGDPAALAALMLEQASAPAPRPDRAELLSRAEAGIQRLSHCLAGAIELAGPA